MTDDTSLEINVNAKGTGQSELNAVADSLSALQERLAGIISESKAASSIAAKTEKDIAGLGKASDTAAKALKTQGTASADATRYAREHADALKAEYGVTAKGATEAARAAAQKVNEAAETRALTSTINAEAEAYKKAAVARNSSLNSSTNPYSAKVSTTPIPVTKAGTVPTVVGGATPVRSVSVGSDVAAYNAAGQAKALEGIATNAARAATELKGYNAETKASHGLSLEAVIGYQIAGAAAVDFGKKIFEVGAAAFSVAASYQSSFAEVQRTTQTSGKQAADLKKSLIDLSTEVPHTFDDIASVAALGGQLGVASSGIVQFTSVVTKLKLTTDLTYDAAGTAIGRISQLLKVPSSQFENLASSILKVGVNSVSTESQIVKTANNLASIGNLAGLTAPQVIGLSGALASLGIPPELARGTFEQLFTKMANAAEGGGSALDTFSTISGKSAKDFAADWNNGQGQKDLTAFFTGLGKQGSNARNALASLGIISVRYVPTLLKLAQNTDVYTKALNDATTGYVQNTALASQYAVRTQTVSARLQVLNNTFHAILNNVGSNALTPFAGLLDAVQKITKALEEFSATPIGGTLITITAALAAFLGVAAVGVGTLAKVVGAVGFLASAFGVGSAAAEGGTAALIPYDAVLLETIAADAALAAGLEATAAGFSADAVAAAEAAAATKVYAANAELAAGKGFGQVISNVGEKAKGAVSGVVAFATSAAGIVTGLGIGLAALSVWSYNVQKAGLDAATAAVGVGQLTDATAKNQQVSGRQIVNAVGNDVKQISSSKSAISAGNQVGADQGSQAYARQQSEISQRAQKDIKAADTQLASLVKSGNLSSAKNAFIQLGLSVDTSSKNFPKYTKALDAYKAALAVANGTTSASALSNGTAKVSAAQLATAYDKLTKSLDATAKATSTYTQTADGTLSAQVAFQQAISDSNDALKKAGKVTLDASGNFDITTQTGRDATTALLNLANAGNQVTANLESQGQPLSAVQKSYNDTKAAVTKLGTSYGLTGDALQNFINSAVAPVDSDYSDTINQLNGVGGAADGAADSINKIPKTKQTALLADKQDAEKKITQLTAQLKGVPKSERTVIQAEIDSARNNLNEINGKLNAIPGLKTVSVSADTAAASAKIQSFLNTYNGRVITVKVNEAHVNSTTGAADGPGYALGGYTGPGGKNEIAGLVHKGEVVFEQEAVQRLGLGYLMGLRNNKGMAGAGARAQTTATASGSGAYITIAPQQMAQLIQAVTTQPPLMVGNQVVANATNAANLTVAKRGANG